MLQLTPQLCMCDDNIFFLTECDCLTKKIILIEQLPKSCVEDNNVMFDVCSYWDSTFFFIKFHVDMVGAIPLSIFYSPTLSSWIPSINYYHFLRPSILITWWVTTIVNPGLMILILPMLFCSWLWHWFFWLYQSSSQVNQRKKLK